MQNELREPHEEMLDRTREGINNVNVDMILREDDKNTSVDSIFIMMISQRHYHLEFG